MKKLFSLFLIGFTVFAFAQGSIDSTKNFSNLKGVNELLKIKGEKVYAIERINKENNLNYPGILILINGKYTEIKTYDDYKKYIENKEFIINDIKENNLFIDIYMSNGTDSIIWSKSPISFSEKPFELEYYIIYLRNKIKSKLVDGKIIYSKIHNFNNDYEFNNIKDDEILNFKSIYFEYPDKTYSRFKKLAYNFITEKNKDIFIFDDNFDYKNIFSIQLYYEFLKNKKEQEKKDIQRKNILTKKYGFKIANRILNGDVWIGMTRQMLIDSKGEPDSIGSSIETKYSYTVQYIYNIGTYTKQYIYLENGKVVTIQY